MLSRFEELEVTMEALGERLDTLSLTVAAFSNFSVYWALLQKLIFFTYTPHFSHFYSLT